jgi:4-diphosphocytidyl-2-C-methyl-D-erythritol kinase
MKLRAQAPGKVNLCLFLGEPRADGRHELLTLFQSLSLADTLTLTAEQRPEAGVERDGVVCEGVSGPNLVAAVLAQLRAGGWDGPPVRIEIDKRIPVAAGMAGGSADAAAALRLTDAVVPIPPQRQHAIAAALGSDIPSQLTPGVSLGTGAGDRVQRLAALPEHAYVVIPSAVELPTADVYREADRLGLGRREHELRDLRRELEAALASGRGGENTAPIPPELIVNDLQPAALSLCPGIEQALADARDAGAAVAIVSGSGPTAVGVWWGPDAATRAASAQRSLLARYPGAVVALPVGPESGAVNHV